MTPRTVEDYDVVTRAVTLLKQQGCAAGTTQRDYVQRREWATAPDGTQVPISLVHRRDTALDGTAPGLLHGYGSYGIPSDPWFSVLRLSLLQRGWVFAIAHVRGGSEMGRSWYDDGKLSTSATPSRTSSPVPTTCGTRASSTRSALRQKAARRVGCSWGSSPTRRPTGSASSTPSVPFVDALTTILDPCMPLTVIEWEEWGNPLEDATAYALMKSYAPYENVRPSATRRCSSRRRSTTPGSTSPSRPSGSLPCGTRRARSPAPRPVIFRTEMAAGHGGQSGRYDTWRQWAWETAVLIDQT